MPAVPPLPYGGGSAVFIAGATRLAIHPEPQINYLSLSADAKSLSVFLLGVFLAMLLCLGAIASLIRHCGCRQPPKARRSRKAKQPIAAIQPRASQASADSARTAYFIDSALDEDYDQAGERPVAESVASRAASAATSKLDDMLSAIINKHAGDMAAPPAALSLFPGAGGSKRRGYGSVRGSADEEDDDDDDEAGDSSSPR